LTADFKITMSRIPEVLNGKRGLSRGGLALQRVPFYLGPRALTAP